MPRIRSIKPEFPQSESIGRLSRDARLCFVQLWTQADDEGRLRGSSRMLASLLYPYDDDAPGLMDGWLDELERQQCITRYVVRGHHYIQITNWLEHQKIDRPTASKLPAPGEADRDDASPREPSRVVTVGSGRGSGKGEEAERDARDAPASPPAKQNPRGTRLPDDWEPAPDLRRWAEHERPDLDISRTLATFRDYWRAKAGQAGCKLDWPATFRNWVRNEKPPPLAARAQSQRQARPPPVDQKSEIEHQMQRLLAAKPTEAA